MGFVKFLLDEKRFLRQTFYIIMAPLFLTLFVLAVVVNKSVSWLDISCLLFGIAGIWSFIISYQEYREGAKK